jgi:hypothetical protein
MHRELCSPVKLMGPGLHPFLLGYGQLGYGQSGIAILSWLFSLRFIALAYFSETANFSAKAGNNYKRSKHLLKILNFTEFQMFVEQVSEKVS